MAGLKDPMAAGTRNKFQSMIRAGILIMALKERRINMKAFLDTVDGLVACKVLGFYKDSGRLAVRVTSRTSFLQCGAIMHYTPARVILPENVHRRPYGQIRVRETDWTQLPVGKWLQDIRE